MEGSRGGWKLWLLLGGGILVLIGTVLVVWFLAGREPSPSSAGSLDHLRARAQDRSVQSLLRNAMVAAKAYLTDTGTYDGFDPPAAERIEPSVIWMPDQPAGPEIVSINLAEGSVLVMSARSRSGAAFCIADDAGTITYGRRDAVNARSAADCGSASSW